MRKNLLIGIMLIATNIFSFTPGKWSPLDKYVLGFDKNGPKSETVKDKDGNVIYKANYEYDSDGRLVKEKYEKGAGVSDGETLYVYDNGKLIAEELYSSSGLLERKKFKYTTDGELKEVILFDPEGKEVLRCKVALMWNELVADGEIKWIKLKETEYFSMKKESNTVWNQEIMDDKKKAVGNVRYILDEKGKLIRRENVQQTSKRKSELKYDGTKVSEFSYFVFKDNDWQLVKTHELSY